MRDLEISPAQLKQMLDAKEAFSLIDCRTHEEFGICRIEGATLIPLHEMQDAFSDLEVEPELSVVVYCHHGVRSLNAVHYLRQLGFTRARSLAGGIERWSNEIDPSVPRY
jgi:rhodanese-related sulfurtransferase